MVVEYPKMAALKDVVSVYKNLKEEWAATPCNLKKCGELLNQLKVNYQINFSFYIFQKYLSHREYKNITLFIFIVCQKWIVIIF